MSSQRWQTGPRGPAQLVAPLQAKSVRVELDQRRDRVVQRQDFLEVAAPGEADLRPRARWSAPSHQPA